MSEKANNDNDGGDDEDYGDDGDNDDNGGELGMHQIDAQEGWVEK